MNVLEDTMLVYRVAKNYYIDGLGQSEIAKMTGISRPQISRLIKRGLELGIVKIDVNLPEMVSVKDMERELAACLGIQSAVIAPNSQKETADDFFSLAATHVANALEGCTHIGIGWGRSMYQVSRLLSYHNREQRVFYPMVGCSGNDNPYLQVSSITDRFAEHFYAKARYLNLPVFRKNSSLTAEEEEQLGIFQQIWKCLDAAVIGIGAFTADHQIYFDEASYDPYLQERKSEVVGDILAHLLLKENGVLTLPNYYHVACPLEDLKVIPNMISVAKGVEKIDAIYRVSRCGYIATLITDNVTAKEILKKYGFQKQS